ncbi:MAG TPA: response regulator transcription factor [Acholeplasma sp.]|nr:response regulator transcription factor [Acholeplasma sp.]
MRILIVEDEVHLNDLLHDYLIDAFKDAKITQVYDGFKALDIISHESFELVLLDVMLPHINGFDLLKKVKSLNPKTAALMLSSLNDEESQLKGYELGADEYVTKPYSPKLVIKKVLAILSRYTGDTIKSMSSYGIMSYNFSNYELLIDGEVIILNKKEWALLQLFLNNIGRVFSREDLLNLIWGYDYYGYDRTVDTHIKRLRQKLGPASAYIKTIYKSGYKFEK